MMLTRRELTEMLVGTVAIAVAGCSRRDAVPAQETNAAAPADKAAGPSPPQTAGRGRGDFLERLRSAVRTSPDHLAARSQGIIATRDPRKAVQFVQSEIAALPASFPTQSGLWGIRGALRSGTGSLRDRADLLAWLLTQMGHPAKVRALPRPRGLSLESIWTPPRTRSFAPAQAAFHPLFDEAKMLRPASAASDVEAGERQSVETLADSLLALIPADQRVASSVTKLELPELIPVVEFETDGRKSVAVALGGLDIIDVPATGLRDTSPTDYPRVEVAVLAAFNPPGGSSFDRTRTHELLRAAWPADQLCGRRLTLTFAVPGRDLHPGSNPWEHPTRVPVLQLSDPHGVDGAAARFTIGQMLTMFGGTYTRTTPAESAYVGPYGPLRLSAHRDELARSARALAVQLRASAFPDISLDVSLRDAKGASVSGLAAPDFVVTEDGEPQPAFVVADQPPARPRVLVLWDGSLSTSDVLKTEADRAAFRRRIADAIVSAAQTAAFDVQVIRIDATPSEGAWLAPETDKLVAAMSAISSSDGWIGLGRGIPAAGAAVAIEVSDNQLTDVATTIPALRAQLRSSGTPVIVIPIGKGGEATTVDIVALSGGQKIAADDPALAKAITTSIRRHVEVAVATTYRIRYRSTNTTATPTKRNVSVALVGNKAVNGTATYTLPTDAEQTLPGGLAGLYLQITVDGVSEVRRLGGVELDGRDAPQLDRLDVAAMDDAANIAFGLTTLAFEPPITSAAEMLDDSLRAVIALDPFIEAVPKGEAAMAQQTKVIQRTPLLFTQLFDPPGAKAASLSSRMRVALCTESAGRDSSGKAVIITAVDVPPTLNKSPGRGAPPAAFRAAMLDTLALSYRESQLSPASAAGKLRGRSLRHLAPLARWTPPSNATAQTAATLVRLTQQYEAWHRLVDADGAVEALWIVDPATGSTTAIDEAGRGGLTIPTPIDGYCVKTPDKLKSFTGDILWALFWLDVSAALISAYCTVADVSTTGANVGIPLGPVASVPATGMGWACVGATVEGVGSLTLGSFLSPVSVGTAPWIANALSTVAGVGQLGQSLAGMGAPSLPKASSRAVLATIFLMISQFSLSSNC